MYEPPKPTDGEALPPHSFTLQPGENDQGLARIAEAGRLHRRAQAFERTGWIDRAIDGSISAGGLDTGLVEAPQAGKAGICCSGGGIRSASFNLGVLQVLQTREVLRDATYLSAVSGGSYIAAALTMVAETDQSHTEGSDGSAPDNSDPSLFGAGARPPFGRGSPEEEFLRNHTTYLVPPNGIAAILWRALLSLTVNVGYLLLAVALIGFAIGATLYDRWYPALSAPVAGDLSLGAAWEALVRGTGIQDWPFAVLLVPLAIIWTVGAASLVIHAKRQRSSEIWQLITLVAVGVFGVLLFIGVLGPLVILWVRSALKGTWWLAWAGAMTNVAVIVAGVAATVRVATSGSSRNEALGRSEGRMSGVGRAAGRLLLVVASWIAGPLLVLGVYLWSAGFAAREPLSWIWAVVWSVGAVVWVAMFVFADVTTWSLHPFYRRRLSAAYALKRVKAGNVEVSEAATAGPKLDPSDLDVPVAVERDFDAPTTLSAMRPDGLPLLLVCAAANVSDVGATPAGRRVTPFTFSPSTVGGPLVGALPTEDYEHRLREQNWGRGPRDVTLMAAVSMSGAAFSPSMGKMTRRNLTFLMALANLRLGVWLPNPRIVASRGVDEKVKGLQRRPGPAYLFRELLGLNTLTSRFIYVTDGGHYENLGLVELLRRGCTEVWCFDAAGGAPGDFDTLGEAIALARSELGVEIDLDTSDLVPGADGLSEAACTVGTIRYTEPETLGRLVYVRAVVPKDAPFDVLQFKRHDPIFPSHSTLSQLYEEARFEAYRALGTHAAERACEAVGVSKGAGKRARLEAAASATDGVPQPDPGLL